MKNPLKPLLFLVAFVLLAFPAVGQKAKVRLTWDPNPESDLGGYRVYYGPTSRGYTNFQQFGKANTNTVTGLLDNTPYYFAVTAFNTNGLESDYSNEVLIVTQGNRPGAPSNAAGSQIPDVVYRIEWRGKTNSNGTVTPIGDVIIAAAIQGPVSVTANMLTNGVVMTSRTVTTTNRIASITGSRSLARPFTGAIDVTRVSFDPDVREEALYR